MSVGWKEDAAEQATRMAAKMLDQQGEINSLRAERDALANEVKRLPGDIADTLLAWRDSKKERMGRRAEPVLLGRLDGLEEAADIARRFKTGEQS